MGSAARGHRGAVPYPSPRAIYIPSLPQALSAAHARNKPLPKKNHTPTTQQEFSRENVSITFFFFFPTFKMF